MSKYHGRPRLCQVFSAKYYLDDLEERGEALGPVLEVTVDNAEEAKLRLVKNGCVIVKDEPDFPRCYVRDPFGLIYNLTS